MGWGSYQEDNQDAVGELVRQEKRKVQVIEMEKLDKPMEPDPRTEVLKVNNLVIIKADGLAINSVEMEGYAFDITFLEGDEQLEQQVDFTATDRDGKSIKIGTFYDIKEACSLLTDLMLAIEENQEGVFDVRARPCRRDANPVR